MTTRRNVGAAINEMEDWNSISWNKSFKVVRRLQMRIVKAEHEGRHGKVKALQRLLTHSFSGKSISVRRVTENKGKWTAGVDGVIWDTPGKKKKAICDLKSRGYKPKPLRRIFIKKSNGKLRPLGIPTMKDRCMQALYLLALDPIAETRADTTSFGFRKERCAADAIAQCFILLARKGSAAWVLEGDIKACFDKINHEWLLSNIPMDKGILRKWLKAGFLEKNILYPTEEGTPQGGICSPVIANMTLDGLERKLKERFTWLALKSQYPKVKLVRYADDFIITGNSEELLKTEIKPFVEFFLKERGLELSQEKTLVTNIDKGFDFLGFNLRKYKGKLLIKPSKKSIKTFLKKIRTTVGACKAISAGELISILNPIIRGWSNYFRHVVSKKVFHTVGAQIFKCIWRWAKRRHGNRYLRWVKSKYFKTIGTRDWIFFGKSDFQGKEKDIHLYDIITVKIQRHVKIKAEANPYDLKWEQYFEYRTGLKMANNLRGRKQLLRLWKEQRGICPNCNNKITTITGWHTHHIISKVNGGNDNYENLVLLHPTCHVQVHQLMLNVVKPRPKKKGR